MTMTTISPAAPARVPSSPLLPTAPAQQVLPLRASVAVSATGWALPVGGAVIGALLFGLPGAVVGAVGGWLLARH